VRAIALLSVAAGTVLAWFKRKVIAAAVSTSTKAAHDRFWKYLREHLAPPVPPAPPLPANQRTYRGELRSSQQMNDWPYPWCIILVHGGVATRIPVQTRELLLGVQAGTLIEMDTEIVPGNAAELVRRVRVLNKE
jgi:hypothetical protein